MIIAIMPVMNFKNVKIAVYVPVDAADHVRKALAQSGAGRIGNYDFCSFTTEGVGRFRPLTGSNPAIGQQDKIEEVKEVKIETICPHAQLDLVLAGVKKAHPYEEPAIDIFPLLN